MGTGIVDFGGGATHELRREPVAAKRPGFRFHLRQLFMFVAIASVVMTALVSVSGPVAMALVMLLIVVGVHVFSTMLGNRLRAHADRSDSPAEPPAHAEFRPAAGVSHPANVTESRTENRAPWHSRGSTRLDWLPKLIVSGMLVGGVAGAALIAIALGSKRTAAAIAVGSLSLAVMGGWLAFLAGGFYAIVRHGICHAAEHHEHDEQRRRQAMPRQLPSEAR